ncbi:MAG: ABC transporter permease subunit [Pseudomonadaceae bacterium]|nr:ABC transporter permease subunit [Pseudomonadaceae bacterium]
MISQTLDILRFELRYQWRSPLFLIVALAFGLLAFLGMASEDVTVGGGTDNLNLNASFAIIQTQYIFSIILMFAAAAFAAQPIIRDFDSRTAEMVFVTGISPLSYLVGRFLGGWFFTFMVGVSVVLFTMLATTMPWLDPERIGTFSFAPYSFSLWAIYLPTSFVLCALFFSVSALTRSMLAAYLAAMVLLVAYVVLAVNTDAETIEFTAGLDPFGVIPFGEVTRYWTVFERNEAIPELTGSLLVSRALWVAIGFALLVVTALTYRFRLPGKGKDKRGNEEPTAAVAVTSATTGFESVSLANVKTSSLSQFGSQLRMELRGVFRSYPFYVILAFGIFNVLGSLAAGGGQIYGTDLLPVTGVMMRAIAGSFLFILFIILAFYSGDLVHRERDVRVSELLDSSPFASGIVITAKWLALVLVVISLLAIATATAVLIQIVSGYSAIEPMVYLVGVFGNLGWDMYVLAAVAVFLQVLSPNKFIGMLLFIVLFLALQVLSGFGFEHPLYSLGTPNARHTDMNQFGHFLEPLVTIGAYWGLFAILLLIGAHLFMQRGIKASWSERLKIARERFTPVVGGMAALTLGAFIALGGWIYYNTNVLNEYVTSDQREERQADYEKAYKKYEDMLQPQVVSVDAVVELYPGERRIESRANAVMENSWAEPISEVIVSVVPELTVNSMNIEGGQLIEGVERDGFYRYELSPPMAPGEFRDMSWDLSWTNPGFVASGSSTRIVHNGTFVNNTEIMPIAGYDAGRELQDNNTRRQYDLGPLKRALKFDDPKGLRATNFGVNRRTDFRVILSTVAGQTAISPGYLKRDWQEDGRHYFEYEMDAPILPFFSFQSARYEVARDSWNDVAIEVYYHPSHDTNVDRMIDGTKRSLDYFTKAFSPYQYRQFRIQEFPRYESFAQSFPNTIPFSEAIGFTADLSDEDDIDYVFYVTAHELAHQWWAHQVIGANVQGGTMIVETLAQYSALMVMQERYGPQKMRRFLRYELDNYLSARGGELIEEMPLALVENQPYVHYRKGSVAMFALADAIGEDNVNQALATFIDKHAFKDGGIYPTALDLVAEFREVAGPEHDRLITDLFEKITLFDLKVTEASFEARKDGKFDVEMTVAVAQVESDGEGQETPMEADITLDIAVFGELDSDYGTDDLPLPLVLEKHRLTSGEHTFNFVVEEEPDRVAIDPYVKMIDRRSDDNLKTL